MPAGHYRLKASCETPDTEAPRCRRHSDRWRNNLMPGSPAAPKTFSPHEPKREFDRDVLFRPRPVARSSWPAGAVEDAPRLRAGRRHRKNADDDENARAGTAPTCGLSRRAHRGPWLQRLDNMSRKITSWSSQSSHEWPNGESSRYSYGIFRVVSRWTNARLSATNMSSLPQAR